MKKLRFIFSFILIFSIATFSTTLFTQDINIAQAASTIQINDKSLVLEVDHYKTLRIKGTTRSVSWYSSNSSVASVSSKGKVFAKRPGTATITASVGGKKITCKVKVIYVKKTLTMASGKTSTLKIIGTKSNATWNSSDESIVTISSKGKVTANAIGTATITASVDGKQLLSKITVIDINHKSIVLDLGSSTGYLKTLKTLGTKGKVTWSSSDKSVATVTKSGSVVSRGAGTATITASVDGVKLTSKVKVLKMSTDEFTLEKGDSKTLKINGTTNEITWSSNKNSVASVSSDGIVTPNAAGVATIIGYVDGRKVTSRVTVLD